MRRFSLALTILFAGSLVSSAGPLAEAAKSGDLALVQKLLHQHSDPNEAEADGTTPLHWAVQKDRADIVDALLSAGAKANVKNRYGMIPLGLAVVNGNAAITQRLLKSGADPLAKVPELGAPLMAAARTGNPDVLKALLAAGANANDSEPATGQTALMWAASEGHGAAIKVLVAAGANVSAKTKTGETPIFFAVRGGGREAVEALLAGGADVNQRTPGEVKVKCNTCDPDGTPPTPGDNMLVVAIVNGHFGLADYLLKKGADPNMAGTRWSALHALARVRNYEETQYPPPKIEPGDMDSLELARRLLAHGADPSARAITPTARRNQGDQNYFELKGATPFFLASKGGDIAYMRLLLEAKADYTTPIDDKTTPLMVASGIGCVPGQWVEPERDILAAVKLLVEELHADINAANERHETALHGAVCRSADSVIQYLVDKGARMDVKDAEGKTPLDDAVTGIFRPTSIGGQPIIIFRFPEHTIALMKKLSEGASARQAALR